jgi:hypothetical protein
VPPLRIEAVCSSETISLCLHFNTALQIRKANQCLYGCEKVMSLKIIFKRSDDFVVAKMIYFACGQFTKCFRGSK